MRHLKKAGSTLVFPYTDILARRLDMHECNKEGALLNASAAAAGADNRLQELELELVSIKAENAALKKRLDAPVVVPTGGLTLADCGTDKALLIKYGEENGVQVDKRLTAEKMIEQLG